MIPRLRPALQVCLISRVVLQILVVRSLQSLAHLTHGMSLMAVREIACLTAARPVVMTSAPLFAVDNSQRDPFTDHSTAF